MKKLRKSKMAGKLRQVKRHDARLKSLSSTIPALKESNLMNDGMFDVIKARFENPEVASLFQNEIDNAGKKRRRCQYVEEISRFCVTFHYYSPRAYNFMAKKFAERLDSQCGW